MQLEPALESRLSNSRACALNPQVLSLRLSPDKSMDDLEFFPFASARKHKFFLEALRRQAVLDPRQGQL